MVVIGGSKNIHSRNNKYIPLFLVFLTIISVDQWNTLSQIGNTFVDWLIYVVLLILALCDVRENRILRDRQYLYFVFYFLWVIIGIIRGVLFNCNGYWDYKNLVSASFALLVPVMALYFTSPDNLANSLRMWNRFVPVLFFCFFFWVITKDAIHFMMTPILLYGFFFQKLSKKWKIYVAVILIMMIFCDIGARAQMIKAIFTVIMAFLFQYRQLISSRIYYLICLLCFLIPILLLILGISGVFNIFNAVDGNYSGIVTKTRTENGYSSEDDIASDTRTFIYYEVITSALDNNYVFFGRTPARGNDSETFGSDLAALTHDSNRYERPKNEVCHPNVFTWLGLIGLLFHCLLYFKSSWLAIRHSKNVYLKIIGVAIAFNWALGWVENCNGFNIMNIYLWILIAIGYSEDFRRMNNLEFSAWLKSCFSRK